MAHPHEADRAVVTASDEIRELFAVCVQPGKGLMWLADELIRVAQHVGPVHLEGVWDEQADRRILTDMSTDPPVAYPDFRVGVFRTVLARMAKLGSDETGTSLNPYGDCFALIRSCRFGPARLQVETANTPAAQTLRITRILIDRPAANGTPAGSAAHPEPVG